MTSSPRTTSPSKPALGVPPTGLVLIGILSVQVGSALAKGLFVSLGPGGTAFLRVGCAAIVLLVLWRPRTTGHTAQQIALAAVFGLVTASMNVAFYEALQRIPLGIAVTIEFCGPLGVAVAGSRRSLHMVWAVLAASGILLLAPWGGIHLDGLGVVFALIAATCWALYIYLSARVGRVFPGGGGLAIAMTAGGLALLPIGIAGAGSNLLDPRLLLGGLAVALLSSVIPYSCELEALRTLPTRVFGVLMSLEPAAAAIMGFLILHQVLNLRALGAIVLVTAASVGASRTGETVVLD